MGPTCCRWRKFLARPLGRTAPRWVLVPGDEDHLRSVDKFRGKDELCTFYLVLLITEITPSARSTLSFAPFALIQQMLFLFVFFHHTSQQKLISKNQKWNTGPLAASQLIFPRAQSTRPFLPKSESYWNNMKDTAHISSSKDDGREDLLTCTLRNMHKQMRKSGSNIGGCMGRGKYSMSRDERST